LPYLAALVMSEKESITLLLHGLASGDKASLDRLTPLLYDELRRIAEGQFRHERSDHTLQPTALVHELYTRMLGQEQPDYHDRAHFLRVAAQVMRRILIDHARIRDASKRGGGQQEIPLDEFRDAPENRSAILVALDDSLTALEQIDPRKAQLIEMRYFGGLTAEESGAVLGLDVPQVRRELRVAQAWLRRELDGRAVAAGA
jgi:RNA polymerase sigma factor (TIGR02999 family)